MKYKDSKEQIDYLHGRIKGLENALKDILKLVARDDANSIPDKFKLGPTATPKNKEQHRFNIEAALSKLDVGNQIHPGTVEAALEECWQQRVSKSPISMSHRK